MANAKSRNFLVSASITAAKVLLAISAAAPVCVAQQNPPLLQITSPANGSVVNPGQAISVTVTSPAGSSFSQISVIGSGPLGASSVAASPSLPVQFSMTIPTTIACRAYALAAAGVTQAGANAQSAPIQIDVERSDVPTGLSSPLQSLNFRASGDTSPFGVLATFTDGTVVDVSRSSYVSYVSTNTAVATVDSNGIITAVEPGTSNITTTYTIGGISRSYSLLVTVPAPLIVFPSTLGFGIQPVGSSGAPRTTSLENVSNSPINITGVNVSGDGDFSQTNTCLSGSPLAPGTTCAISVKFSPIAVGARSGSVNITDDSNPASFSVSLIGTGETDFSLSLTPTTQSVKVRASTTYSVAISSIGGFTGSVALSLAGLPASTTASFKPTSVTGGSGGSTLSVVTSSKTPLGSFTLSVTGSSGNLTHTGNATLTVTK